MAATSMGSTAGGVAEDSRHPMTGNEMSGAASGGLERHAYDVVVIGAGGAGLRAAIAARRPAPPAPTTTTS